LASEAIRGTNEANIGIRIGANASRENEREKITWGERGTNREGKRPEEKAAGSLKT